MITAVRFQNQQGKEAVWYVKADGTILGEWRFKDFSFLSNKVSAEYHDVTGRRAGILEDHPAQLNGEIKLHNLLGVGCHLAYEEGGKIIYKGVITEVQKGGAHLVFVRNKYMSSRTYREVAKMIRGIEDIV